MFYTTEHYRYSLPTAQMVFSMLGDDFPIEEMIVSNIRTDLKLNNIPFSETDLGDDVNFLIKGVGSLNMRCSVFVNFNKKTLALNFQMFTNDYGYQPNILYEKVVDSWMEKAFYEKLLFGIPVFDIKIWEEIPYLSEDMRLGVVSFMNRSLYERLVQYR